MLKIVDEDLSYDIYTEESKLWQDPKYATIFPYGYTPEKGFCYNSENITHASMDDEGHLIGFIDGCFDYDANKLTDVTMVNFTGRPSMTFGKDVLDYFYYLFEIRKINKANWCTCVGSPAEKFNDGVMKLLGGRVAAILKQDVRSIDGRIYDTKMYEVMKEDYFRQKKAGIVK